MAFECQESVELANDLSNFGENLCEGRIRSDHLDCAFCSDNGSLEISRVKPCCEVKKGNTVSCGSKQLSCDKVLSGYHPSIIDLPPALISEILDCLDPKELGIVSCVSTILYRLASEHQAWKEFYRERWGLPVVSRPRGPEVSDGKLWKELFVEREFRSKTFLGRYSTDALHGHTEAVRTVFLLASAKLIFTSGYDCIVRMWDMEEGFFIASSKQLGCTIRAVAADAKLLVAGGTDGFIHCWRAVEGLQHLFDLKCCQKENTEFRLREHEGPITSLALDSSKIFSGSWDMSVRVWDRSSMKCIQILRHSDWVWGFAPHEATIASASGSDVYIWDTNSGTLLMIIRGAHEGNTYSLARSHTGNFLFTGGEDGGIKMFEITRHMKETNVVLVAKWMPHTGPVYSLAFEFPWLVSASGDGKLALIDVRKLLKTSRRSLTKRVSRVSYSHESTVEPPQRMLHGYGSNLFSVAVGADRIVCGGEEGIVRIWNFTEALEVERRARAMRGIRLENRMRRRRMQMEMNAKGGRSEQCSVVAHKSSINGDRNREWRGGGKHGVRSKVKA